MVPILIGYARVSTLEQSLDLQTDVLNRAGCEKLFTDKAGGARAARPGLDQALAHLRKGDSLVVWKLDRLGRSIRHLIETVGQLQERKVGFRSLQESIGGQKQDMQVSARLWSPVSRATCVESDPSRCGNEFNVPECCLAAEILGFGAATGLAGRCVVRGARGMIRSGRNRFAAVALQQSRFFWDRHCEGP